MANHIGSDHTSFVLSNDDLLSHLDEMLDYIDEPFADSSAIPVSLLSKRTKEHISVALSGDGGDEIFGGYWQLYYGYLYGRVKLFDFKLNINYIKEKMCIHSFQNICI